MADDKRLRELVLETSPEPDDLVYLLADPSGSGQDRKATLGSLGSALIGLATTTGTAAALALQNPILAAGQGGYAINTRVLAIGDGVTPWNDLPKIEPQGGRVLDVATSIGGGTMTGITTVVDYPMLPHISFEVGVRPVKVQFRVPWASCNTAGQGTGINLYDVTNAAVMRLAAATSGTANAVVNITVDMWLYPDTDAGPWEIAGQFGRTGSGTCTAGLGAPNPAVVASLEAIEY
jgi:hypothetical protein